jgi:phosphatidate phosphatase PAH1
VRPEAEVAKSTEYEVDDEDEEFIEALNKNLKKKEHSSLTIDKLENIIDFLEKELYYKVSSSKMLEMSICNASLTLIIACLDYTNYIK